MEARAGTPPYYILECWGNVDCVRVCMCARVHVCALYWEVGLAEISSSISPISKFMSTMVGSVIARVEIKVHSGVSAGYVHIVVSINTLIIILVVLIFISMATYVVLDCTNQR